MMEEALVSNESQVLNNYEKLTQSMETSRPPLRDSLYRFIHNIFFRFLTLILILTDSILIIVDISKEHKTPYSQHVFDSFALVFVCIFCVEISLRIYATGSNEFFKDWYHCLDFVVIVLSLFVTLAIILANFDTHGKMILLIRLIRAFRLLRIIRLFFTEPKNLQQGMRHVVSENKRRYRGDGFDLDLTYITPRVIGMSFPSSGTWAFYRNNIKDVAKFFDQKHGRGRYKIYNLCSERTYDVSYFHGRVATYAIDDHNVPTLEQMLSFVKDVKDWLSIDERNVIAVHCKGGKGRTGTMICAWLVYNGHFDESAEVLEYFGDRRTDTSIGSKYQGVETPSQARYIDYFSQIITQLDGIIPENKSVKLETISIEGIVNVGHGDGSDISCNILIDRQHLFHFDIGTETNCSAFYNRNEDILIVTPINCPILIGDVRFKFNCRSKKVPKGYEGCAFYFWINTSFIKNEKSISFDREVLDNPHKIKTWKIYTKKFKVTLNFA